MWGVGNIWCIVSFSSRLFWGTCENRQHVTPLDWGYTVLRLAQTISDPLKFSQINSNKLSQAVITFRLLVIYHQMLNATHISWSLHVPPYSLAGIALVGDAGTFTLDTPRITTSPWHIYPLGFLRVHILGWSMRIDISKQFVRCML